MNKDLKTIKKLYGEDFMHLCKVFFPTILEEENALPNLLTTYFEPQKNLYDDLIKWGVENDFKLYIYNNYYQINELKDTDKTPQELLLEKDYILYECKTEEDIQSFKHYYRNDEELCTFLGDRLNKCHVFWAVKKNALELNREDFVDPKRQDEYGTSVISIQFSKDPSNILSIKNRYNHTVPNCDATFGNNLENIIEGLTKSFEKTYNLKQKYIQSELDIPGYIRAKDGKLYKFNYETDNIYYCPNNIIIDCGTPMKFDKEKFLILDYFIMSLGQNPKIMKYDRRKNDSFTNDLNNIKKVKVVKYKEYKEVTIIQDGCEDVVIKLDDLNRIIGYKNNNLKCIDNYFLQDNLVLAELDTPNVESIKNYALFNNEDLETLNLPKLKDIGENFMFCNQILHTLYSPELKYISNGSFWWNESMTNFIVHDNLEMGYGVLRAFEIDNGKSK